MILIHISLWEVHPSVRGYLAQSNTCLAGPGGSVLANRLSANPNNRVLLIEAGPRFVDFSISMPQLGAYIPQRYGRSIYSYSVPRPKTCTIYCLMELYHGPSSWFGRALDPISSRTNSWRLHFDQYVVVTFGGHHYRNVLNNP
jgi:choline dehydrogenase-like flavoprotein